MTGASRATPFEQKVRLVKVANNACALLVMECYFCSCLPPYAVVSAENELNKAAVLLSLMCIGSAGPACFPRELARRAVLKCSCLHSPLWPCRSSNPIPTIWPNNHRMARRCWSEHAATLASIDTAHRHKSCITLYTKIHKNDGRMMSIRSCRIHIL